MTQECRATKPESNAQGNRMNPVCRLFPESSYPEAGSVVQDGAIPSVHVKNTPSPRGPFAFCSLFLVRFETADGAVELS
jgi:hypothetical protein